VTLYRYKAAPLRPESGGRRGMGGGALIAGELAADSPAALRASLRRVGLQVVSARPVGRGAGLRGPGWSAPLVGVARRHARARRVGRKAELYDSLATMLEAGLPVADAVGVLVNGRSGGAVRGMLVGLREGLRDGASLDACMERAAWWFESGEVAMVRAARASGELPSVLRSLAARHERAGELGSKVVGALAYPAVVSCVGVGVVVFLSAETLPDLVTILSDAGIEAPGLTLGIMRVGGGIVRYGPLAGAGVVAALCGGVVVVARLGRGGGRMPGALRRLVPGFARRVLLARAWGNLAELVRTGVPLVEALRLTAPTLAGGVGGSLARALVEAAGAIERGSGLAEALEDRLWFDDECRRLIGIGETAGELPEILERLAARTHRSAARAIERLTTVLEPAVILALAAMIGLVVMGAVLPILKLQEIIG